ncbi:MAG: hypothetical protein ABEI86_13960 [Halobacteriaceae archaeon]
MEYALAIEGAPDHIPGGTAILLLHPSTAETDRIDTEFLRIDTDHFFVVSTRTTARGVKQKLDYYNLDASKADILDTLSVERGLSRRSSEHIHYVSAPDDIEGIITQTREFFDNHSGKLRLSFDSLTELAYYANDEEAIHLLESIVDLLETHDAVGLFHVDREVHTEETLDRFISICDAIIEVDTSGAIQTDFPG